MEDKVLRMYFEDVFGVGYTISLDEPNADITEDQIKSFMDLVITKNIFTTSSGQSLTVAKEAKIVTTATTEFDLVL